MSAETARLDFDATVTGVVFAGASAMFACGDGTVRRASAGGISCVQAHDGAALCIAGAGGAALSGGADGRLVRTPEEGPPVQLAEAPRRWIDPVAASASSGLLAYGAGKAVRLLDAAGATVAAFAHATTVAGLAFSPLKGKRLAAAHYGGVSLWWANASAQTPKLLPWKGAHSQVTWSRDEAFVVSAMQENALHGWRLADMADLRMTGYPAKVKSLSWLPKGRYLATAGAEAVICWPFFSKDGPMGKAPVELPCGDALVTAVAAHPRHDVVAAGDAEGHVRLVRLPAAAPALVEKGPGSPVTALAWSGDGARLAFGREDGSAGLLALPF